MVARIKWKHSEVIMDGFAWCEGAMQCGMSVAAWWMHAGVLWYTGSSWPQLRCLSECYIVSHHTI